MKAVLAFSLLLAPPGESWFGRDKLKHFFVSAFVQSVTFATMEAAGADRSTALAGASLATVSLGVGKEVLDRRGGGSFSSRDLVWNAAGAGAATLLLVRTER